MDEKELLLSEVKNLNKRALAICENKPELLVHDATINMYLAYVKKMKPLFPENEEVKSLKESIGINFRYADLYALVGRLLVLLRFLLRE